MQENKPVLVVGLGNPGGGICTYASQCGLYGGGAFGRAGCDMEK